MKRRKIYFGFALTVTIGTLLLLVTGSSILTMAINVRKTIPYGTIITWAGLISLPLAIYWGIKELRDPTKKLNRILSGFLKALIILGFFWVPISFLLAGNLSFSFSESDSFQGGQIAARLFWSLSFGIVIGAILTIVTYWISLLFSKK